MAAKAALACRFSLRRLIIGKRASGVSKSTAAGGRSPYVLLRAVRSGEAAGGLLKASLGEAAWGGRLSHRRSNMREYRVPRAYHNPHLIEEVSGSEVFRAARRY